MPKKNTILGCCFILCLIITSGFISSVFMDSSYDGRWYHQTNIILLSNGWNPIYSHAQDFLNSIYNINVDGILWCEHYTKFVEICAANILKFTNRIEAGKLLNIIFAFIVFGFSFQIIEKKDIAKNKFFQKFILAFILIINPVFLCQMFTYYLDGILYCLFVVVLLSFINLSISKKLDILSLISLLVSTVMILNIKFGALLLVICAYLVYFIYFIICKDFYKLKQIIIVAVATLILCAISGINPYFTNIKQNKHILYPICGTDIARKFFNQRPIGFNEMSVPKRFLISSFSKVEWQPMKNKYELKIPFSIYKKEFVSMAQPDPQICGFGVFWSGIVLLSIILLLNLLYKKQIDKSLIPLYLIILLSVVTNPSNFYARYVPQLYALTWLILININKNSERLFINKIVFLLIIFIILNSFIVFSCAFGKSTFYYTIPIRKQLKNIEQHYNINKQPINVFLTHEISFLEKLKEYKIEYKLINKEPDIEEYNVIIPSASKKSGVAGVYWK